MKLTLVQLHLKYKWLLHGMQAHRTFQFQLRWNPALDYLIIMTTFLCLNKWNIRSLPFFHNIINLTSLFLWVQFPYEITPWNSKFHGIPYHGNSMECLWIGVPWAGLLIGCKKKLEIMRHFYVSLCGKKGLLCGKLCDFILANLTLFY